MASASTDLQLSKRSDDPRGLRAFLRLGIVFFLVSLLVSPQLSQAEENTLGASTGKVISIEGRDVVIPRPGGWRNVAPGDSGVLALFRANRDRNAQIEVRASSEIPTQRWDRYIRSFEQELLSGGFQVHQSRIPRNYGGLRGTFVEYQLSVDGELYRLLVWHVHVWEHALVFAGFFRESRRDSYFDDFEEMLRTITWE